MKDHYKYIDKDALSDLADYIKTYVKDMSLDISINKYNELVVELISGDIVKLLTFMRDDTYCKFEQLLDICAVDYIQRDKRFEVVYTLLSVVLNQRIRVKLKVKQEESVKSVSSVYSSANWYEREAWDMFGIVFSNNKDLRRILTDYGFEGHPLRKDFPLVGFVQVRYDENEKRVIQEPLDLEQNFRLRNNTSPWRGYEDNSYHKNEKQEKEEGQNVKE